MALSSVSGDRENHPSSGSNDKSMVPGAVDNNDLDC